jgi:release factor glutamine methyltransferase
MDIQTVLKNARDLLKNSPTSTARLDTEVLLGFILQKDRSWLHAHPEYICRGQTLVKYDEFIIRRTGGEPVAYIIGRKEFYGRDFAVNKDVLVPRPESESFIELLKPLATIKPPKGILNVLDLGTGSGCIAITVKIEYPYMNVFATDTSKKALRTAIKNSQVHSASINFKDQDILSGDKEGYDVILANMPYVPDNITEPSIMYEPGEALFSGKDGLDHYKKLFQQLEPKHIRYVMTESLLSQHKFVEKLAFEASYKLTKTDGLVQLFTKLPKPY